jgi:hypothetical protein
MKFVSYRSCPEPHTDVDSDDQVIRCLSRHNEKDLYSSVDQSKAWHLPFPPNQLGTLELNFGYHFGKERERLKEGLEIISRSTL